MKEKKIIICCITIFGFFFVAAADWAKIEPPTDALAVTRAVTVLKMLALFDGCLKSTDAFADEIAAYQFGKRTSSGADVGRALLWAAARLRKLPHFKDT